MVHSSFHMSCRLCLLWASHPQSLRPSHAPTAFKLPTRFGKSIALSFSLPADPLAFDAMESHLAFEPFGTEETQSERSFFHPRTKPFKTANHQTIKSHE